MADRDPLKPEDESPPLMSQAEPIPGATPPRAGLDPEIQAHIGKQLRAVYDDVVNEAIPDRFLKLLQDLDRKRDGARDDKA